MADVNTSKIYEDLKSMKILSVTARQFPPSLASRFGREFSLQIYMELTGVGILREASLTYSFILVVTLQ